MTLEDVYQFYGNITQAAEAVNVSRQTFHAWMRKGFIPFNQQQRYEKLSNGLLKSEKNPSVKKNDDYYIPSFRYYSETLGMCEVHSLTYFSKREPRVRYYDPGNRQLKFASFDITYLMQSTSFIDSRGSRVFEHDFIRTDEGDFSLSDIHDHITTDIMRASKKILIVGNKFEGHKDGHKRSK